MLLVNLSQLKHKANIQNVNIKMQKHSDEYSKCLHKGTLSRICESVLTLVMQEIQSSSNVLHDNSSFMLTEVLPLVNVCQNGP